MSNQSGYIYQAGIPPKQVNTLNYTGTPLSTVPVVNVPRAPTVNDGQFPLFTLWRNSNTAATLPDAEGDLWYFAKVNTSVYPVQYVWNKIATGTTPGGTMIGLTDTALTSVLPNGAGFIQLQAGAGVTVTSDPSNNRLTIALSGGGSAIDQITTDSGVVTPDGTGNVNLFGQNVAGSGIQTSGSGSTASHRMISPYDLGNFSFTNNAAATKREVGVFNLDADPASESRLFSSVFSGSAADPYIQVGIAATMNYCWGIDNSDSDTLKVCANANSNTATPSGGTLLYSLTSGGNAQYHAGDLRVESSEVAGDRFAIIYNTDNTDPNSDAYVEARARTGNPFFKVALNASRSYAYGIDQTDSNKLKIRSSNSNNATPVSGTELVIIDPIGATVAFPIATWTQDGVLYADASNVISSTSAGTAGQVLTSNGPGVAPTYQGAVVSNYTQGTFVPVLSFGGGTTGITYSNQGGAYTRIGNVVNFTIAITLTNKGSSTGVAAISGLPFAISAIPTNNVMSCDLLTFTAGYTYVLGSSSSGTSVQLFEYGSGVSPLQLTDVSFANNTSIVISGFYGI